MRRLLLAALLAASGCAAPEPERRIRDNDPVAAWYSEGGPYRRGDNPSKREFYDYGSVVPDPQPRRK